MKPTLSRSALAAALLAPLSLPPAALAADPEVAELKAMLEQMKRQYEGRIADLEARLSRAERGLAETGADAESQPMTAPAAPIRTPGPATGAAAGSGFGALSSGTAFNPQISVILDGNYYHDTLDGEGAALVGEAFMPGRAGHVHSEQSEDGHSHAEGDDHDHVHATTENGFNFREAELAFSATVDPYFDAAAYIAIDGDGNVHLEEGYFQTRALPYGLRLKAGKFLSEFGYTNRQHPHEWDFVDQNLPYLNLLGMHGLQDTGVQLGWLPELPVYTLLGFEALQGDQEIFGATLSDAQQAELALGDTDDGPRLWTAFVKVGPDLGPNHALRFGVSYAHASQHQEVDSHTHAADAHEHEGEGEETHEDALIVHETGLAGDADLWGLDLVYKYDGGGAHGHRDFKLQAEYLRSIRDLSVRSSAHPEQIGSPREFTTDGLYAQAVYGFLPKWRAGVRYDVLGLTNEVSGGKRADYGSSDRWTFDVTWDLSEFSRLRAQYAYNNILVAENERERFDAFYLQFLMSLGAHGAHGF